MALNFLDKHSQPRYDLYMGLIILFAVALLVAGYFHWTAFSN